MKINTIKKKLAQIIFHLTLVFFLIFSSNIAEGDSGWYPTHKGETIIVEYCLPKIGDGPIYLQGLNQGTTWKNIAKIKAPKFKKDSYCEADFQHGSGQGFYHLKFKWKVNVSGEWGLQAYSPNLKMGFIGWPDGIESRK